MFGKRLNSSVDFSRHCSLTLARGRGYFSDPYKEVDNRPPERDQAILLARWNHYSDDTGGALRSA